MRLPLLTFYVFTFYAANRSRRNQGRCLRARGDRLLVAHVDLAALEFDEAVLEGEDRVIAAQAYVKAGVELRAALADDDRPGLHRLPAPDLDPTILRIAVAAVFGRALTLLMCHVSP